uniref:Uncharacterized protein n=1 Tax=Plectus sambesii TaxID=2011161 RepID=A0A914XBU2_9BILA
MSWNINMMCDVMPTISEDAVDHPVNMGGMGDGDGLSGEDGGGGQESRFEQLMVNMLDERDKLLEKLQEAQRRLEDVNQHLRDSEREKDSLRRQVDLHMQPVPQVGSRPPFSLIDRLRVANLRPRAAF